MIGAAYEQACQTPSDIFEHLPVMRGLAVECDAKKIIELGTRTGVSTLAWLAAVEQTGGHVWSIDLDPGPDLEHPQWTFIQGSDLDPAVVSRLPDDADVVFVDTSHDYQQTLAELNVYRWKVRPGGLIVLHDTENARPLGVPVSPRYPVKTAVEEFCAEELLTWRNLPNCWGLGIVTCG